MSQTDVRKLIPGGEGLNVPVRGEFVFLKSAGAKIKVTINNETVEMEPGDVRRVVQPFNSFEAFNTSGVDQSVVFVVGFGDYSRIIVSGEIDVKPKIRRDSGLNVPDTSYSLELGLMLDPYYVGQSYQKGEKAGELAHTGASLDVAVTELGTLVIYQDQVGDYCNYEERSLSGDLIGTFSLLTFGGGGGYYGTKIYKSIESVQDGTRRFFSYGQMAIKLLEQEAEQDLIIIDDIQNSSDAIKGLSYNKKRNQLAVYVQDGGFDSNIIIYNVGSGFELTESVRFEKIETDNVLWDGIWLADNGEFWVKKNRELRQYSGAGDLLANDETFFLSTEEGLARLGSRWITSSNSQTLFIFYAAYDFAESLKGYAMPVKIGQPWARVQRIKYADAPITGAAIAKTNDSNGTALSGELIRAALELYFGKKLDATYLDYVTGVEIHSNGYHPEIPAIQSLVLNGETFAAAGYADNWTIGQQGWLKLTIDAALPFLEI